MEDKEDEEVVVRQSMRRARNLRRIFWLGCLWIAAWLAMCLEQAITNTDPLNALKFGAVVAAFIAPLMLIFLVPLGLLGRSLGNLKPLLPYRWWISLALPMALCLWPVVSALMDRGNPGRVFKRDLNVELPPSARNVRMERSNIILADRSWAYVFECTREETEQLIDELELGLPTPLLHPASTSPGRGLTSVVSGWRNPKEWKEYNHLHQFITVWTDETMTQVCVLFQTI